MAKTGHAKGDRKKGKENFKSRHTVPREAISKNGLLIENNGTWKAPG